MVDISRLTAGVNLPARVASKVFADTASSSAFLKATGLQEFSGDGEIFHSFGQNEAFIVGETGEKTISNPEVGNIEVTPKKFVVGNTFSDELVEDHPTLVDAVINQAPSSIARKVDSTIAGTSTVTNFTTLGNLSDNEIHDSSDLEGVVGLLDGAEFGIVLSSTLLSYLRGLRNTNGSKVFEVAVDPTDRTRGTIEGYEYFVYRSANAEGFVADWNANAVARQRGGVRVKSRYAGFTPEGSSVDIASLNMIAVLTEARIGFGVNPLGTPVAKIVRPTTDPDNGGGGVEG